jgi:hypothetical protein
MRPRTIALAALVLSLLLAAGIIVPRSMRYVGMWRCGEDAEGAPVTLVLRRDGSGAAYNVELLGLTRGAARRSHRDR